MASEIYTDPIDLSLKAGTDQVIEHGFGHEVPGWVVIWRDAPVLEYAAPSQPNPKQELVLRADSDVNVRIVLLS